MNTRETLKIKNGHLEIGGADAVNLAKKYGTPLYVMDEAYIRKICHSFNAVLKNLYPNSLVCYASKAFSCKAIYGIVDSMGLGADVVSGCELLTALEGGMPAEKLYFHGNNKLASELELAVKNSVHAVVIDNIREADLLDGIAASENKKQKILVRVNPGIDAHTHHFIQTTRVDSKFGFSIADKAAINIIKKILTKENLEFVGIHCHIGSQIFEVKPFELAVEKMTDFMAVIKKETGKEVSQLNLGGGYGITYTVEDKPLEPHLYVEAIVKKLNECLLSKKLSAPKLILEPGRSIVGEAGVTLYTVGGVKDIPNVKKYVNVDGGMFDNPRFALYQAKYEAILANRADELPTEKVTVAGKCCESGDVLAEDAFLPEAKPGDILAVFSTGAYNYSMASNYNRNIIPPVVLVKDGQSAFMVKPQSYQDIMSRDCCPDWLK